MTLSSAFCLAQKAAQRDRAAEARLDNVRIIATVAAATWAREAALALCRELKIGHDGRLPAAASLSEQDEDALASENPDRGLAGQ